MEENGPREIFYTRLKYHHNNDDPFRGFGFNQTASRKHHVHVPTEVKEEEKFEARQANDDFLVSRATSQCARVLILAYDDLDAIQGLRQNVPKSADHEACQHPGLERLSIEHDYVGLPDLSIRACQCRCQCCKAMYGSGIWQFIELEDARFTQFHTRPGSAAVSAFGMAFGNFIIENHKSVSMSSLSLRTSNRFTTKPGRTAGTNPSVSFEDLRNECPTFSDKIRFSTLSSERKSSLGVMMVDNQNAHLDATEFHPLVPELLTVLRIP